MTDKNDHPRPEDDGDAFDKVVGRASDIFNKVTNIDPTRKPDDIDRFIRAVKLNKIDEVRAQLDAGFNPNVHNTRGDTPLHVAARENLVPMAQLLVDHDADPRLGKKDDPKHLPLDDAVNFGKPEMTEFLARQGGYLPGNTINGWSLLHRACEKGKPRLVEALLKAGANGNEPTENGATPLLIAVMRAQAAVADILLDFPGVIEGMNTLFVKTDEKRRNAFQLAVERGQSTTVRKMIDKGTHLNVTDIDGLSPLMHAIARADVELVRLLAANGADLNTLAPDVGTPLLYACEATEIRDETTRATIIGILLKHGADADMAEPVTGRTPLISMAGNIDRSEALHALLQFPVSRDLCDKQGMSAVFHALKNPRALDTLLQHGASPDARHMKDSSTPLIAAAKDDNLNAVKKLLAAGANTKLYDARGKSALSYARDNVVNTYAGAVSAHDIVNAIEEKLNADLRPRRATRPKPQEWDL